MYLFLAALGVVALQGLSLVAVSRAALGCGTQACHHSGSLC